MKSKKLPGEEVCPLYEKCRAMRQISLERTIAETRLGASRKILAICVEAEERAMQAKNSLKESREDRLLREELYWYEKVDRGEISRQDAEEMIEQVKLRMAATDKSWREGEIELLDAVAERAAELFDDDFTVAGQDQAEEGLRQQIGGDERTIDEIQNLQKMGAEGCARPSPWREMLNVAIGKPVTSGNEYDCYNAGFAEAVANPSKSRNSTQLDSLDLRNE